MRRTLPDLVADNFGWSLLAGAAVLISLLAFAISEDNRDEAHFMAECAQDHKAYECEAMWRAGEPKLIAVPVVAGR